MFSHAKKGVETLFPPHYTPEYIIQYSKKRFAVKLYSHLRNHVFCKIFTDFELKQRVGF